MKIAAIAPMYNEEILLPHFLRHYACFCDRIILLDNGSNDRSLEIAKKHPKVEIRHFTTKGYDEHAVLTLLAKTKKELAAYDWLMFPDIDEFLMTKPPLQERDLLAASTADILVAEGYCLVERAGDPPFDPELPISRQRRWAYWAKSYCKPIIMRASVEMTFGPGKHALIPGAGVVVQKVSPFVLVHAETIDFKFWQYRKNRRPLSRRNIENGWSVGRFCKTRAQHMKLWQQALQNPLQGLPVPDWSEIYA
jgi:glycosyltransferase involved in cell wall biosynthesis